MRDDKILVLGGGGFIGTNLCNQLVASGRPVVAFGRSFSERLSPKVKRISGNFGDISEIREAVKEADIVYHLIHGTNPPSVNNNIISDLSLTVQPTVSMLEACVEAGVKRVIFASSGGTVYGLNGKIASREDDFTAPISAYGAHKLLIENYLRVFYQTKGLEYISLRISNPYGPYQPVHTGVGLIAAILHAVKEEVTVPVFGDGQNERDYIYI